MPSEGTRLGILSALYVNTGTYGAPAWQEIDLISDLAVNPSYEEGDSSARRSIVKTADPTMMTLDLPGKLRVDRLDAGYLLLEEAFLNRTMLDILALNGKQDQEHSAGFRFDGKLFNLSEDQAMGAILFKDFTIKPCASLNPPQIAVVTGGTPVFRDFGLFTGS